MPETVPHPQEPLARELFDALRAEAQRTAGEDGTLTPSIPPWEFLSEEDRQTWCRWAERARGIVLVREMMGVLHRNASCPRCGASMAHYRLGGYRCPLGCPR